MLCFPSIGTSQPLYFHEGNSPLGPQNTVYLFPAKIFVKHLLLFKVKPQKTQLTNRVFFTNLRLVKEELQ